MIIKEHNIFFTFMLYHIALRLSIDFHRRQKFYYRAERKIKFRLKRTFLRRFGTFFAVFRNSCHTFVSYLYFFFDFVLFFLRFML